LLVDLVEWELIAWLMAAVLRSGSGVVRKVVALYVQYSKAYCNLLPLERACVRIFSGAGGTRAIMIFQLTRLLRSLRVWVEGAGFGFKVLGLFWVQGLVFCDLKCQAEAQFTRPTVSPSLFCNLHKI
jgi:hypothetical protein